MKQLKRFGAALLALALLLSLLPQAALPANADTPVPEDGVLTVRGIRGDICYLLWWMAGSPEPTSTANPYTDISEEDYYFKAVLWAVSNGIAIGVSNTSFDPDLTCTRAQIITFLCRYYRDLADSDGVAPVDLFDDVKDSRKFYYDPVYWATGCSWIDLDLGDKPNVFRPDEPAVHLVGSGGSSPTFAFRDHDYVNHEAKEPTCTEVGWDAYDTCSRCDYSSYRELSALGHDYVYHVAKEPTCTEAGWVAYDTCSRCDYSSYRELPARGHNYENGVCTVCGEHDPDAGDPSDPGEGNKCGVNLFWSFDESTGVLTITGSGAMEDYTWDSNAPWYDYSADITEVKLPEGLTTIGEYAFRGCSSLTSITIPDSVTSIGDYAFYGCSSLTSVTIPDSVTSIGLAAFSGCSSLTSITIPDGVTSIGSGAFYGTAFYNTESNWKDGLLYSGHWLLAAYENCSSAQIHADTIWIADGAFSYCSSLENVTIPNGVTSIGGSAFSWCTSLTSVTIPDSVTSIGEDVFLNCSSLASVTIPDSVTRIGVGAFYWCRSLTSVTIPDSVTSIGEGAFYDCDNLTDVYYGGDEAAWNEMEIGVENDPLKNATIHYNSTGPTLPTFSDVAPNAYYAEAVSWAVANEITNGTGDGKFSPSDICTRGQVVAFLWRAFDQPKPTSTNNPFTDVKEGKYYYDAVLWAVENGITSGTGNGKFSPNGECTRGQVVTFLWRAAGKPAPKQANNPFADMKQGAYYYDAVLWAVEQGVTKGTSDTSFSPDQTCTRGQVVTFLFRASGEE